MDDKILNIIKSMGKGQLIEKKPRIIDSTYQIKCRCGKTYTITVGAIYKQHMRGHSHYRCKKCAGLEAWTEPRKLEVGNKSREKWHDPEYAGTITGKAIAHEIIKKVGDDFGI